ncbi:MAG: hypothetical protein KJ971_08405 [Firmicutes bacterium]|nr:hypothetical protein [Bacillota bacterium]
MIRIIDLKLELKDALTTEQEMTNLTKLVLFSCKLNASDFVSLTINKKAIDARRKDHIFFVFSVDVSVKNEKELLEKGYRNVSVSKTSSYREIVSGTKILTKSPVIVGFGPSGIFAALLLSRRGYSPIVLERGLDVYTRSNQIQHFYKSGEYNDEVSILFGEGGAGTFSDGKLTTLISDDRCRMVLETLVQSGANKEILYLNKPHIGTDCLKEIIKNIREEIILNGGEIIFNAKVTNFIVKDNILKGVVINNEKTILTDVCLLGIGHSARDTFEVLHQLALQIVPKAFSIGVRIEHPQKFINQAQYGKFADASNLEAADYKMAYHSKNNRSAYTFCMCPGGYVVCATSESGGVVTNGMSENKRDSNNANSALLVNVTPNDFHSTHPLSGVAFQKEFEEKAFLLGGKNYYAPIQLVGDFLKDKQSTSLGEVIPSYKPGVTFVKMSDIFPPFVINTMKEAILDFDHKLKGFAMNDAVLTGVETRSSSPIRMIRNEFHESNISGLFPMGEGAGYAGGIMSSAVDGIKTAEQIINKFKSVKTN